MITWGSNEHGQCGHGEKAETDWVKPRSIKVRSGSSNSSRAGGMGSVPQPYPPARAPRVQMLHEQMVTQVVCGRFHTLCVTATSQVFAWGLNRSGQLGLGDTMDRRAPAAVDALWAMPVLQLAAGESAAVISSNIAALHAEAAASADCPCFSRCRRGAQCGAHQQWVYVYVGLQRPGATGPASSCRGGAAAAGAGMDRMSCLTAMPAAA